MATRPCRVKSLSVGAVSRKFRVLIVDDEHFVLRALKRGLADMADVVGCHSRDDALAVLDEDSAFDVVISDLGLLGASGLDLRGDLARRHPHLLDRFVLMSGEDLTDARVDVEVLAKPFNLTDAREVIGRIASAVGASRETR